MRKWAFCLLFLVLVAGQFLQADEVNLTVNLHMTDCYPICDAVPGAEGEPSYAHADFSLINEPWSFDLMTAPALDWLGNHSDYGYGGYFNMNGPDGLTFTGVVTSGTSDFSEGSWDVVVSYFGQWSNGVYAEGTADVFINESGRLSQADLISGPAPEPSSFVLLGSGLLGIMAFGRRVLHR
jgi:hypothetical protein